MATSQHPSRTRILDAALATIRAKGYEATTIDDLCRATNLTKGGFFHHFRDKEDLAVAAAGHFSAMADRHFAAAPYRKVADPLQRVLAYVDFRIAILRGKLPEYTCLLGTMVQEVYETHPAIRQACDRYISAHAADVAADIAQAKDFYCPDAPWSAESLGLYTQAVIQGSFILAKARNGPAIAADCLMHLRRYIELLFDVPNPKED
jgi:TetR/AcrR family transcriptional repressor of nem operon